MTKSWTHVYFFIAESNTAFSTPTAAPVITSHPDSDSARKLFLSNISAALPSQQTTPGLSNSSPQNISYLYKIQHGNDISYIWQVLIIMALILRCREYCECYFDGLQKDVRMPLDLSPFACNQIQVSFSVVAESGHSEFSPAQTICLDGGKITSSSSLSVLQSVHMPVSLSLCWNGCQDYASMLVYIPC